MPSVNEARSRSGVVDNSAKSVKGANKAGPIKGGERPMAAAGAAPAYHQVQPNVQPGSVAASLSGRASNISVATADLAAVLARLGMYDAEPRLDQTSCSTENVLAVLDNHVDLEVRSLETFLTAAIYGAEDKEVCDECDQEEVKGGVAETNYGSKFFYHADVIHSRLRDIDRKLERIRVSLLGERPAVAEAKTANNDSTASLHQCVSVLISRIDTTVERVTELTSDIRNGLLGE
ncbi:hypothetical protein MPK64_gp073 [Erwinia phage pEa_SNUABM_16]|uniref:Uncharacterized protein n=1 Tax=Erwinia phage pEa_SNUABM_16 TaxID=2869544 RepID=A0AAE8XQR3_9CAUD|nr:hypothetical protein MPK64_gp073 [Erwinia phage pEa_SNUABM_16]QZE58976.1 hypothetical protein pEaSNUABM18_00073 [Erwinia phage pEa_SNUABM_18]UAW96217.1 hypothetical protein pEaSNUABM16_00073 [Erwinia phage pEa_SNUABM_16]